MIRILLIAMLIFSNALQSFAAERASSADDTGIAVIMTDESIETLDVTGEKKSCCHEGWLDKASGASCKPDCKMVTMAEITVPRTTSEAYGLSSEKVPPNAMTSLLFRPPIA